MSRYDWTFGGWQGGPRRAGWMPRPQGEGYGEDFRGYGQPGGWGGPRGASGGGTYGGGFGGPNRYGPGYTGSGHRSFGDFGRGTYGDAYEGYGGPPGAPRQGQYYGGGGYGAGRASQGRGYDAGYARAPFIPEEAYRRHPEYDRPPARRRWEAYAHEDDEELGDREVREAVRRRLGNDAWLDAQRISVEVADGVVTLTGEVDDFLEARYAWDDAWETEGVRGVVNSLTVRTDLPNTHPHGDMVPQSSGERANPEAGEGLG
jgi:hypothetical protein